MKRVTLIERATFLT